MSKKRRGNDPKRRIASPDRLDKAGRETLAASLVYVGSAHHKRRPANYGFHPPVNPRPWKSICDGIRVIPKEEAVELFQNGVMNGMFSNFPDDGVPKYVWAVDSTGEVYEANIGLGGHHGYRLEEEDDFRGFVLKEWKRRCQAN